MLLKEDLRSMTNERLIEELLGASLPKKKEMRDEVMDAAELYTAGVGDTIERVRNTLGEWQRKTLDVALELGRRFQRGKGERRVTKAEEAWELLKPWATKRQEHFIMLALDGAGYVLGEYLITIGSVNRTIVHPREVFAPAIEQRATRILVSHNHPSGLLLPSREDKSVTERLESVGELVGIPLHDHVIITEYGYWSFREHSMIGL